MNSGRCVFACVRMPAGPDHGRVITNRVDDHDNNPSTRTPINTLFVLSETDHC